MSSEFATLVALHDLVETARKKFPDIYQDWCDIDRRLASLRKDEEPHSRYHLDANFDLVLRMAEAEQVLCYERHKKYLLGGTVFAQIALSKMWLFSTYELLRASCDHSTCTGDRNYCHESNCYRCKVLRAKQKLAVFRVHLGKLETTKQRGDPPSDRGIPDLVFGDDGSIGWRSMDKERSSIVKTRLELSDHVLETLVSS